MVGAGKTVPELGEWVCVASTDVVLIAAPDAGFRDSLEFALQNYDYSVHAYAHADDAFASDHAHDAACAVIDDDAITDWDQIPGQVSRFAKPVILLLGQVRNTPELPSVRALVKPFLGAPLIEAVRCAIAAAV